MKEIKVTDIYEYQNISSENSWNLLYNKLKEFGLLKCNDKVMLDFDGISLIKPQNYNTFKLLLTNDNIYMRLYNCDDIGEIKVMCLMSNYDTSRVENVNNIVEEEKVDKKKERLLALVEDIKKYVVENGDYVDFNMYKAYNQITPADNLKAICYYVEELCKTGKYKEIRLNLKEVYAINEAVDMIVDLKNAMKSRYDVMVAIDTDVKDVIDRIRLDMNKYLTEGMGQKDKLGQLKKLKKNQVGLLIKYKASKSRDRYGRYGNGETASCRIAVYKGVKKAKDSEGNDTYKVMFDTYNSNTFYTKAHLYELGEDIEDECIECNKVSAYIDSVGLDGKFTGSSYAFARIVQTKEEDLIQMDIVEKINNELQIVSKTVTIPERAKYVFDDFDIEYDEEELLKDIKETRRILNLD